QGPQLRLDRHPESRGFRDLVFSLGGGACSLPAAGGPHVTSLAQIGLQPLKKAYCGSPRTSVGGAPPLEAARHAPVPGHSDRSDPAFSSARFVCAGSRREESLFFFSASESPPAPQIKPRSKKVLFTLLHPEPRRVAPRLDRRFRFLSERARPAV